MLAVGYVCQECNEEFNGKSYQCNFLCKTCKNKDPIFYLQRKLENALKKEEVPDSERINMARLVMQKCQAKSVISGIDDPKQLCITRVDTTKPWSVENAVLMTYNERKKQTKNKE